MAKKEINIFSVSLLDLLSGALGAVIILYVVIDKNPYKTSGGFEKELLSCDSTVDKGLEGLEASIELVRNDLPADEYRNLKDQLENVKNDLTCFRQIIDEQQEMIVDLNDQLQNARDSIAGLMAENSQLRNQVLKQDLQIKELSARVRTLEQENQDLTKKLRQAEAELLKWKSEANFIVITMSWTTTRQDVDMHIIDPSGAEFYYKRKTIPGRRGELTEDDKIGPGVEIWQINGAYKGEYRVMANLYDRKLNFLNPTLTCKVYYRKGVKNMRNVTLTTVGSKVLIGTIIVGDEGEISFR